MNTKDEKDPHKSSNVSEKKKAIKDILKYAYIFGFVLMIVIIIAIAVQNISLQKENESNENVIQTKSSEIQTKEDDYYQLFLKKTDMEAEILELTAEIERLTKLNADNAININKLQSDYSEIEETLIGERVIAKAYMNFSYSFKSYLEDEYGMSLDTLGNSIHFIADDESAELYHTLSELLENKLLILNEIEGD